MPREVSKPDDIRRQLSEVFLLNDRVNQLLLENLDAEAWRAKPPGKGVRTIAAIFSHVHNVRRKWLRLSLPDGLRPFSPLNQTKVEWATRLPAELDRLRCTQEQAAKALKESARLCAGLAVPGGRASRKSKSGSIAETPQFVRDGWAKPWDIGDAAGLMKMLAYMVSHEAHHRGQVCMLAHQMGYRLPMKVMAKMWDFEGLRAQGPGLRKGKSAAD